MDPLALFIEQETAKLRIIETEAAALRQRIQTLKGMQSGSDLDAFLAGKISLPSLSVAGVGSAGENVSRAVEDLRVSGVSAQPSGLGMVEKPDGLGMVEVPRRRKKGEIKRALLSLLDRTTSKHLLDLISGMGLFGYSIDNKRMRAEMWAYANEGLVQRDKPGYFRLTEQGAAFLERQKGENPAGTGLSGATVSGSDLA